MPPRIVAVLRTAVALAPDPPDPETITLGVVKNPDPLAVTVTVLSPNERFNCSPDPEPPVGALFASAGNTVYEPD